MLVGVGGQTSSGQGVMVGVVVSVGVQNSGGQNVGLGVGVFTTPTVIEMLSTQTLASLAAISPSTRIEDLDARILIMHDREDDLVPSEESRRLADALGNGHRVYHTELSLVQHVDPTRTVSPPVFAREVFKLFLHMYNVLRELS